MDDRLPLFEQPWPEGDYRFFQLGFVVDDLVDAARRWVAVFGVGPFHVLPARPAELRSGDRTASIELQVAVAQSGPVQIELIHQGCDTPSIFRDHLTAGGRTALHQLCTVTDAYEAKVASLRHAGYELVSELVSPGHRVAYIDTVGDFGFYTEVVESSPAFLMNLAAIDRTCAEWDGTDPVRLLTRGGYTAL